MKKYLLLFTLAIFGCSFFSCTSGDDSYDDELIEAIRLATKESVESTELPSKAINVLDEDFNESTVDKTLFALNLGYEVTVRRKEGSDIGEKSEVYFGKDGKELRKKKDGKREKGKDGCDKEECFEIVFPITMTLPDGSTITGDKETLGDDMDEWYQTNPDSKEKPEFLYPVQIIYKDGITDDINSDEAFKEAYKACK